VTQIIALVFIIGSILLTIGMLWSRRMMFGFPAGILWAVTGGFAYQIYTVTWDMWYITFFACFGMAIFCFIGMYVMRRGDLSGPDKPKFGEYIDENGRRSRATLLKPEEETDEPSRLERGGQDDDWLENMDMHSLSAPRSRDRVSTQRRVDETRGRLHNRAEERKKEVRWGEFK